MSNARPLSVAVVGFGTVGRSVAKVLCRGVSPSLRLAVVCNRNIERKKVSWVPADVRWTDRFDDVLSPDVDIVVELMGGLTPARDVIRRSLLAGKAVVTANKQLISLHGVELLELARQQGRQLLFEASVAGGIPIVRAIREGLAGDRLFGIAGILNGTCNYIMSRMDSAGLAFAEALKEAQTLGFAEADPTDDVDGFDARAKLAILIAVGLRCQVRPADIPCQSISRVEPIDFTYAHRLDCTIRQISWTQQDRAQERHVFASVHPALVPLASPLARVQGSQNLVTVQGEFGGETTFSGFGAGGDPTAVAVVSDLVSIARQGLTSAAIIEPGAAGEASVNQDFTAPHYVRFTVTDRPGIIAALATVLSRHGINIDAVVQLPGHAKTRLPFVMTLEACPLSILKAALEEIEALPFHVEPPMTVPILGATRVADAE
jgi:homoserine dehydrogenase